MAEAMIAASEATARSEPAEGADRSALEMYAQVIRWLEERGHSGHKERFAVRAGTGFRVVSANDIVWIEAADNYVQLHTLRGKHLLRSKLSDLQRELDPTAFVRIHRSSIVRVDAVEGIEPWGVGEFLFILSNGAKVSSSRRYRDDVRAVFFGS